MEHLKCYENVNLANHKDFHENYILSCSKIISNL